MSTCYIKSAQIITNYILRNESSIEKAEKNAHYIVTEYNYNHNYQDNIISNQLSDSLTIVNFNRKYSTEIIKNKTQI